LRLEGDGIRDGDDAGKISNRTCSSLTLVIPGDLTFEGNCALMYLGGNRARDVDVPLQSILYRGGTVRIGANVVEEKFNRGR
jgi:hypothetical protein